MGKKPGKYDDLGFVPSSNGAEPAVAETPDYSDLGFEPVKKKDNVVAVAPGNEAEPAAGGPASQEPAAAHPVPSTGIIGLPNDPFGIGEVVAKSVYSGFAHQIPGAIASIPALDTQTFEENLFAKQPSSTKRVAAGDIFRENLMNLDIGRAFSFGEKEVRERILSNERAKLGEEGFNKAKAEYEATKTATALEARKKYEETSAARANMLQGVPQSYQDIKSPDDAVKYVAYQFGQSIPTMAAAAAAPGIGSYLLEATDAYNEAVDQTAQVLSAKEKKDITAKDVISRGLDMAAKEVASNVGIVNAILDVGGLASIAGSVRKILTKDLAKEAAKRGLSAKLALALKDPLLVETLTEPLQEFNTAVASKIAAGKSSQEANQETWQEYPRLIDAAIGGLTGAGGAKLTAQISAPDVVKQSKAIIKNSGDQQAIAAAANAIEQNIDKKPVDQITKEKSSEGLPNASENQQRLPGEVGVRQEPEQTGPVQEGSQEAPGTGGNVQTHEGGKGEQPVGIPEGFVSYEDATKIEPTVEFQNLPKGEDEGSREARSQIIRDQETQPPKFTEYPIGTKAIDKYGEVHELQDLPFDQIVTKDEGTQRKETIDKYAGWIEETGKVAPAKGVENFQAHGGKVVITDGNHRVQAAKQAGLKTVPVWVALTDKENIARPIYAKNLVAKKEQPATPTLAAQELQKQITDAETELESATTAFKAKAKELDKGLTEDQENLFGERKSTGGLFDVRADASQREKTLAPLKAKVEAAKTKVKDLRTKLKGEEGKKDVTLFEKPETKKAARERLLTSEPRSIREAVLQYFARGGRISPESMAEETGFGAEVRRKIKGKEEFKKRKRFTTEGGRTVEQLAEHLALILPEGTDQQEIRNEVINVLTEHESPEATYASLQQIEAETDYAALEEEYYRSINQTIDDMSDPEATELAGRVLSDFEGENDIFDLEGTAAALENGEFDQFQGAVDAINDAIENIRTKETATEGGLENNLQGGGQVVNQQEGQGTQPPGQGPPGGEPAGPALTPPIYNNAALYTGEGGVTESIVRPEVSEEQYQKIANENAVKEARRIVTENPSDVVEKTVFDQSNDMEEALRVATALELAVKLKDAGDRTGARRIFDKYREMGTKSGQAQQMRSIARDNPKIQVLEIVAKTEGDNRDIRQTKQPDGETTGKKLDTTHKNLIGLADEYGVAVSESESVDQIIEKILSKGLPKSERVETARKKMRESAAKLREAWKASQGVGIVFDPKKQAKQQIQFEKALRQYIGDVIEVFLATTGETLANITEQVMTKVREFIGTIGIQISDADLKKMVNDQLSDEERKHRYTPPINMREREEAVAKIKQLLLPKEGGKKGIARKPAIQEFYERLIKKMGAVDKKFKKPEDALKEVLGNLDKYTSVLEGVRDALIGEGIDVSDVQSIFDLPYFEKQIQKNVTSEQIKGLIKQHYTVRDQAAQSLADKLIEQYGLTGKDAKAVERVVNEEFARKAKEAAQKELTKLYGSSQLTKPKAATKTDADKIIEAMNMGAFNDDFYTNLVGEKFGMVALTDDDIATLETLAERVQTLPPGELRNQALRDFMTYTEGISNQDKVQQFFKNLMDLWYRSALSGFTTQSRSLKGAALQSVMSAFVTSLNNPVATIYGLRGLKSMYRGLSTIGLKGWLHIFRTGHNPFGGEAPRPRTWWQKIADTSYIDLIKDRRIGAAAAKTWAVPLNVMWNGMIATDALFRYTMKEYENYIAEYNALLNIGGNRFEQQFWTDLNKRLALDPVGLAASKAQLEQEIEALKANGEAIPQGYESRRLGEITDGKRDQRVVGYAVEKGNESVLMNDPVGILGALYRTLVKAGEVDAPNKAFEKNKGYKAYRKAKMLGKFLYRQTFPFLRVATNYINRAADYTPLGFARAYSGGRETSTGWREMSPEERTRHLVMASVGSTMITSLAMSMFDLDDDEGLILDEDCPIQITGLGLGPGKYQQNKDIDPTRQDLSFRIRYPDGTWSDYYTYRDNPLGMVMYPLGQASDDLRFKKFAEVARDDKADERHVGTYLATTLSWAVQFATALSYQQGIRNLLDMISFDERSSSNDKVIKAAIAPVKSIALPNLYRQAYQQAKAILDQPEKKAYGVLDQMEKDIPLVESLMDNEAYDQLGYPIVRDFDFPLVPDYVLHMVKENRYYRMTKPEWQLVYKYPEVTLGERFRAPSKIAKQEFISLNIPWPHKDKQYIDLSTADQNKFVKSAGDHMRKSIHDNLSYLNKLDAISLQRKFNDYRSDAYRDAKIEISGQSLDAMLNKMTTVKMNEKK